MLCIKKRDFGFPKLFFCKLGNLNLVFLAPKILRNLKPPLTIRLKFLMNLRLRKALKVVVVAVVAALVEGEVVAVAVPAPKRSAKPNSKLDLTKSWSAPKSTGGKSSRYPLPSL